eukprot:gene10080-biopygen7298
MWAAGAVCLELQAEQDHDTSNGELELASVRTVAEKSDIGWEHIFVDALTVAEAGRSMGSRSCWTYSAGSMGNREGGSG